MHDTHTRTGTLCRKLNTNLSNLKSTANQINNTTYSDCKTYTKLTMDNNNNNRQIPDRFALNDKLKYHWGADDEIMKIINRRDNSPETKELVERRITLTSPGHMRHHWQKKLERNTPPKKTRRRGQEGDKTHRHLPTKKRKKTESRISEAVISKTSGTNSHKHTAQQQKITRKQSVSRNPHQIPNLRSPQHQKSRS